MALKLNPKERKVLAASVLDRRDSISAISKRAGVKSHTAVYVVKKLEQLQVVRPFTMFNLHALGLTDYCVFFNVIGDSKRVRNKILEYCVSSTQTGYVAELSGKYQYSVSIFARSIVDVESFFDGLLSRIANSSIELSFAIRSQWSALPLKYLDPLSSKLKPLSRLASVKEVEIDDIDRKILMELSKQPAITWSRLAGLVGLSVSGIHYRIEQLQKSGVILGYAYCVDGTKIGRSPFRILMITRGIQSQLKSELFAFANSHPMCTTFVRCLGAWDFELNFDLEQLSQGGEVVEEIHDKFGKSIQSIMTVTELGVWKVHEFIPQQ